MTDTDSGLVIYHVPTNTYYSGFNKFESQLRKAKIYHKERYLREAFDSYCESHNILNKREYIICEVETRVANYKPYE